MAAAGVETDAQCRFGSSSSLPVPNVQQLAKENPTLVPTRYIRDDIESPAASYSTSGVPVIDLQKLLREDSGDSELHKLHFACRDWGFFQLINHGVDTSLVEKAKREVLDFFNLPLEVKKNKYGQVEGEVEGYGQTFVVSEEQKLDWADMFYIHTLPPQTRSPRLFSNLPESFRETMEAYSLEVNKLAMKVLSQVAKNLGIEEEEMSLLFEDGMQSIRMNYYPPCPLAEHVIGLSPHSDVGGLTILLQANETQGLEIKKDGKWIPIVPIANAFIVNVGDCVEIFSNGIYPSIEHRGVVSRDKERISIATFHSPKLDGELGPATNLVTSQTPANFKRVSVADYFRLYLGRKLDGKSHTHVFRIGN
ncbi:PREDICTED: protein SRG1-like isoform X1 [Ipomoea nil]|uniref:protein SRG1-like isoform X1 n=1 Tax=Ipomoea nil TaxID=35883 RepID=UPI000901F1D4|nr:PREDICTED: protein SRG1-like isoform X1 [Ipomoea nil]